MPKTKISEYSATANSNTDVASVNIDEGCAPSGINNAIRAVMGHLKDFQAGTSGDAFNGATNGAHNGSVGATTPAAGTFTTLSATGNVTLGDAAADTVTVNGTTNFVVAPTVGGVGQNGFKNRIINGDFRIDQRNAGAAVTNIGSDPVYTVDRFRMSVNSNARFTAQQITDAPAGFVNSLRITTTTVSGSLTAGQYNAFLQIPEGFNCADFGFGAAGASAVTVSFWAKSSLAGTFPFSIRNGDATRSYVTTFSLPTANTWTYITLTILGDTSGTWDKTNSRWGYVAWSLGDSTATQTSTLNAWQSGNYTWSSGVTQPATTLNATFQLTGVQLEKGSTATSFDYRPYGTELALCQRYYQQINGLAGDYVTVGTGGLVASATVVNRCPFPMVVSMRSAPTMSLVGGILYDLGVLAAVTTISGPHSTPNAYSADLSASGGGLTSVRSAIFMLSQNASNYAALSAEL